MGVGDWIRSWPVYRQLTGTDPMGRGKAARSKATEAVVARTATHAFVNAALPYILQIADLGAAGAISQDPGLEKGINTHDGKLIHLTRLSQGGTDGLE